MYSCSLSHTYYAPWFEARNSDLHATSMCLLVVVSDSHVHSNDYDQVLYCTIQLHQTFPIDNHALTPSSRDSSYMYTLITQLASSRWVMDAHAKTLSPSWILWYHKSTYIGMQWLNSRIGLSRKSSHIQQPQEWWNSSFTNGNGFCHEKWTPSRQHTGCKLGQ